uniref:Putative secreted protein n=1 Tax=Ixodes ricinus TaxID=34613 RepID=A0A6B0TXU0_IXORI
MAVAAAMVVAAAAAEVEAPARETVRDQTGKERLPTARLRPPQIFSSPPWNPWSRSRPWPCWETCPAWPSATVPAGPRGLHREIP